MGFQVRLSTPHFATLQQLDSSMFETTQYDASAARCDQASQACSARPRTVRKSIQALSMVPQPPSSSTSCRVHDQDPTSMYMPVSRL